MSLTNHHTNFLLQIGGPHTFVKSSPTNFRNKLRFNSCYPNTKIVPVAIMLLPNFSNRNIATQVDTLNGLWLHKNGMAVMLLRTRKISKAILFFSRQRNATASGLFSHVKAVLLLSPEKTPVMIVLIPRHKNSNSASVFLTSQNVHCHCCSHDRLPQNHF